MKEHIHTHQSSLRTCMAAHVTLVIVVCATLHDGCPIGHSTTPAHFPFCNRESGANGGTDTGTATARWSCTMLMSPSRVHCAHVHTPCHCHAQPQAPRSEREGKLRLTTAASYLEQVHSFLILKEATDTTDLQCSSGRQTACAWLSAHDRIVGTPSYGCPVLAPPPSDRSQSL